MKHHQGYKTSHQTKKENPRQKARSNDTNTNKLSAVKNSLQSCMGFMDGLCCASLSHVSAEDRQEIRRENLREYMASYDLSYLNSNIEDGSSNTSSSSNSAGNKDFQPSKSKNSSVQRGTTQAACGQHTSATARRHTILFNSMLPRDYGNSELPSTADNNDDVSYLERSLSRVIGTMDEDEDEGNSCCHSFQQFHGFDDVCQHELQYTQPRTFTSSDTYSTVSLSQSYGWDDDDEQEANSDCILSPRESVFRKDEHTEAASEQHDDPSSCSPSPSFPTSSLLVIKTHEAYQYLLRMTPQNYMHGSGWSDDKECDGSKLDDTYCYSNRANSILGSNSSTSTVP